ncbi:Fanconi anemia core complex-associated protein 100 [Tamandua tetradactyla]|uniref:Fanconi anemia core complex-associated protein 100 n=1 Tax=Tamandua tetradactyla TaxID=48850 RepID=UPI00405475FD
MAGTARRVEYLAGFRCPVGGLAAGKSRVLRHEAEIFLCTGREFVYVYDQGGKRLRVVYQFPDQVWHLEFLALCRVLYVLCAGKGIYCLSLDPLDRLAHQAEPKDEDSTLPAHVVPVDPGTRVLPDATLCAFMVLDDVLVTLAQGTACWKMQLFEQPSAEADPRPGAQIGEADFSCALPAGSPGQPPAPRFLPVLCCLGPPGSGALHSPLLGSRGFTLQQALFTLLFGADAALLKSPVILCGLPGGQLCCVVVKTLAASGTAAADPKALVKILHHLEEPVVFIGALRTELQAEEAREGRLLGEDVPSDCLVALGHHGRTLAIKASWDEAGNPVPDLQESRLPGPVLCATCGGGSRLYHSTPSGLCVVDLAQGAAPSDPSQPDGGPGGLPPLLCPASLDICSVVALSVSSRIPEGGPELLALSAKGRLMTCILDQSSEAPHPAPMTAAKAGQKIKELLSGIGHVSERVSSLKKAVDQRNRALTCLNEAMSVSCALLSSRGGPRPISCSTTATWSHLPPRDVLVATCLLENSSTHALGRGWTLCIQVRSSTCALGLSLASPAITYTVPVEQLGPGSRREVTLTLGPSEDGVLDLPITVSCALFYSLREVIGAARVPSDSPEHPFFEECPPDILPERDGICLPLGEHTVDLLQCLRFPGLATPGTQGPADTQGPTGDPVDTFLSTLREPGIEPMGPTSLWAKYLPPSVASIRVSSELLRATLDTGCSGASLCCATLQWLLAENPAADGVRTQALSSVQGVAPDGGDVHLSVHEVAVTDLCPAGPIQAVDIQVESSSLANLCRAHHALVSRMQAVVVAQAARGSSPPELRVQYLRQMHAGHEALLREVQTLRDQLCGEDEAQACTTAERLLQVYRRLRHPGLLLL